MHVVLYQPEIPANTGNIARTCAVTGSFLHLVRPLGFSTSDRYLKRAGLDYWPLVKLSYHDGMEEIFSAFPGNRFFFLTTRGALFYHQVAYRPGDFLVFGRETAGLPPELLAEKKDRCLRIPMAGEVRSLNLANSVAVVLYEALRRQDFPGLV
ncbi:MAG: tRNA (uridine(34)/cytosine(34)/5-carboxymethylaminomethyluridine(34)-2'-O)-methyltransferase TrmL [Peptococcaceae bacterium]|nr:tRNA (uridine(34)/cytosine(34)/5-carboxymethylaminomethyluridine(34)-2'-O)-methyltransferase TrmL [Peptococcaceae bacterium]